MLAILILLAFGQNDGLKKEAQTAFASEDYQKAALAAITALRNSPDEPEMLDLVGRSFLALGDFPHAVAFFEREVRVLPANTAALRNLSQALSSDGRFDDAYELLTRLTVSHPAEGENWTQLGFVLYKSGYYPAALAAFGRALTSPVAPQDKNRVETLRVICWVEAGSLEVAVKALPELLSRPQNLSNLELRLTFVRLLYEKGNLQGAHQESNLALTLAPENAAVHLWRARIFQRQEKLESAVAEAERSESLSPSSPAPRNLLVRLYQKIGRDKDAQRETVWLRDHDALYSTSPL